MELIKKTKHIGIVACSYEGAALCYKTICNEGSALLGPHAHPEVSMHTIPLSEYMRCIELEDWNGVAQLMHTSAQKLISIGADVLICPDNTIHRVYEQAIKGLDTPWLHIASEVAQVAKDHGFKKIGILGTKYLMESEVYPDVLKQYEINYLIPNEEQRWMINEFIFQQLVYGILLPDTKRDFLSIIDDLKARGCDSVVLGCTEIPLIVLPGESSLPTLDSTRILARAALKYAVN
jgi:aspartate racemase